MDNFFGTWKQETKSDNMKTLLDITDVTDKEKELMTNMLSKFAFSKNGDKYNIVHSCDDPPMSKSYLFTLGEPLETTDIFGRKIKSTLNLVNPNLLTESCSEWTDGVIDVSYEISGGDTMTVKFLYKGVTCTSILKKVSP